jgi:hypothetical protein
MRIRHQTKRCVRCKETARLWTGFVQDRNGRHVLAGWCGKRCLKAWWSCHGPYRAELGKESVNG